MITRPYYAGKEVPSDEFFFDRKKEVARLELALSAAEPTNIAIIGLRRSGKTTLMKKVAQGLKDKLAIFIKCEKLLPSDEMTFFRNLIKELLIRYSDKRTKIKEGVKSLSLPRLGITVKDIDFWIDLGKDKVSLKDVMDKAFSLIDELCNHKLAVVFLDEFHELFKFGKEFLWALRAHISDSKASYVIASSHHRFLELLQDEQHPFFNFFEILHIGSVDRDDAEQYLKERIEKVGLSYEPEIINLILENSKLNPYYIQLLGLKCYENAVLSKNLTIDRSIYELAFADALDNLPSYLLSNYYKLRGRTRDVFVAMCAYDFTHPSEIADKVNLSSSNVMQILKQIEEAYGIVKKSNGEYVIVDMFLKEFVRREQQ